MLKGLKGLPDGLFQGLDLPSIQGNASGMIQSEDDRCLAGQASLGEGAGGELVRGRPNPVASGKEPP